MQELERRHDRRARWGSSQPAAQISQFCKLTLGEDALSQLVDDTKHTGGVASIVRQRRIRKCMVGFFAKSATFEIEA